MRQNFTGNNVIQAILDLPRENWLICSDDLRDMWLDFPDQQELFENLLEEKDPFGYDKCIARAILWFNGRPPRTRFSPINFIDEGLLLDMSFTEVLKVAERFHASNFSTASAGGTSMPINERYVSLGAIRRELEASCNQRIQEWKIWLNNEAAWGSISDIGARGEYGTFGFPF